MNLGELRTAVFDNTGRTDKTTVTDRAINLGIEDIVDSYQFRDLRVQRDVGIVVDQASIIIPTDYHQVVDARLIDTTNENSNPIRIKSKKVITDLIPNPDDLTAGRPSLAYEESGSLFLIPKSNGVFIIRLLLDLKPTTLVLVGDNPQVDRIDRAIIAYATSYVYDSVQQFQQAAVWTKRYNEALAKAILSDDRKPGKIDKAQEFHGHHGHHGHHLSVTPWLDPFVGHGH